MQKLHKYQRNYCPIVSVMILLGFVCASFSMLGITAFSNSSAYADTNTSVSPATSTINVNLSDGITIRVLDSTATSDLEDLVFDFIPTDEGISTTKNAIVEVGTSNETGYKLYMQSDWEDHEGNKTTSLIHTTNTIEDSIPTRLPSTTPASTSDYPFWYYYNTKDKENKVIPAYGNPDTIAETKEAVEADRTTVPITVGVDTSIVSGTYRNKLVFTAVGNQLPVDYKLTFDSNGGTGEEGELEAKVVQSSYNFTIPKNKVIEEDTASYTVEYGTKALLGWSEDPNATTPDYVAGDSVTLIAGNQQLSEDQTAEKTLYAVWRDAPSFFTIENMQDMTANICSSVYTPNNATGSDVTIVSDPRDWTMLEDGLPYVAQSTLSDIRGIDGTGTSASPVSDKTSSNYTEYIVRKLADGRCWMNENLRLTLVKSRSYEVATFDGGTTTWAPNSGSGDAFNVAINANTKANVNGGKWYYPWYAATAGQGTNNASPSITRSICPKGWRLPYSITGTDEFTDLIYSSYNVVRSSGYSALVIEPFTFQATGIYITGKYYDGTAGGGYWSASPNAGNSRHAYSLRFSTGYIDVPNADNKYMGYAVRCIAI